MQLVPLLVKFGPEAVTIAQWLTAQLRKFGGPKGFLAHLQAAVAATEKAFQLVHAAKAAASDGGTSITLAEGAMIGSQFVTAIKDAVGPELGELDAASNEKFVSDLGNTVFPVVFKLVTGHRWGDAEGQVLAQFEQAAAALASA